MNKNILLFLARHKLYVLPVLLAVFVFIVIILLSDAPVEKGLYNYSFF